MDKNPVRASSVTCTARAKQNAIQAAPSRGYEIRGMAVMGSWVLANILVEDYVL
jgi:hypothetical protein